MIKIEGFDSESGVSVKEFVVSLSSGDKKRCRAEGVRFDDGGALSGIVYDRYHARGDDMSEDVIWAFAPGTWVYVERDFAAEENE